MNEKEGPIQPAEDAVRRLEDAEDADDQERLEALEGLHSDLEEELDRDIDQTSSPRH